MSQVALEYHGHLFSHKSYGAIKLIAILGPSKIFWPKLLQQLLLKSFLKDHAVGKC